MCKRTKKNHRINQSINQNQYQSKYQNQSIDLAITLRRSHYSSITIDRTSQILLLVQNRTSCSPINNHDEDIIIISSIISNFAEKFVPHRRCCVRYRVVALVFAFDSPSRHRQFRLLHESKHESEFESDSESSNHGAVDEQFWSGMGQRQLHGLFEWWER